MTRRLALVLLLAPLAISLAACATHSDTPATPAKTVAKAAAPSGSGTLTKVELGMNDAQVRNVLGDPDDSSAYMTGKAFIPFYFGPDTHRADWIYEGQGRVVFSRNRWTGGLKVIEVKPIQTAGM